MKISNYKTKAYRYNKKLTVRISFEIENLDTWEDDLQFVNRKLGYNEWMMKHVVNFCPWDYSYNTNLFADSLRETGKSIVENGNVVNHVRLGRRALWAAEQLEKSLYYDYSQKDHSYRNHIPRTTNCFRKLDSMYSQLHHEYNFDNAMNLPREEYERKMSNIISNRHKKIDRARHEDAWDYIKKWIGYLWD